MTATGENMLGSFRTVLAVTLLALGAAGGALAQEASDKQTPVRADQSTVPPVRTPEVQAEPTVTVLGSWQIQGVLGREVRSNADENMGRIVDVIVDRAG